VLTWRYSSCQVTLWMILIQPHFCWRRSLRACDYQLTWELDSGNWRSLFPSPVLEMYNLPISPTAGTIFTDTALSEQCVVEIMCHGSQLRPLHKLLRFWWAGCTFQGQGRGRGTSNCQSLALRSTGSHMLSMTSSNKNVVVLRSSTK